MDKEKLSADILTSFLQQFAENQNHNQKLFIQFFLGVMIVIVGYSIIYSNTSMDAAFWKEKREGQNMTITSYAIGHLLSSYWVAQLVLIFLTTLTLHTGYCFRRDQAVVFKIRHNVLGEKLFNTYFGKGKFTPFGKGTILKNSFVPNFDVVFFWFILILQIVLFFSIIIALGHFKHDELKKIVQPFQVHFFGGKIGLPRFYFMLIFFIPIMISDFIQGSYYVKYLKKIDELTYSNFDLLKYKINVAHSLGASIYIILATGLLVFFETIIPGYLKWESYALGICIFAFCVYAFITIGVVSRLKPILGMELRQNLPTLPLWIVRLLLIIPFGLTIYFLFLK